MSLLPETASFTLIVSLRGDGYSVAVEKSSDPDNFGVFSDQTGLIYTGRPLN